MEPGFKPRQTDSRVHSVLYKQSCILIFSPFHSSCFSSVTGPNSSLPQLTRWVILPSPSPVSQVSCTLLCWLTPSPSAALVTAQKCVQQHHSQRKAMHLQTSKKGLPHLLPDFSHFFEVSPCAKPSRVLEGFC